MGCGRDMGVTLILVQFWEFPVAPTLACGPVSAVRLSHQSLMRALPELCLLVIPSQEYSTPSFWLSAKHAGEQGEASSV